MNPLVFNICILLGWLMVLVGGCMLSAPIGLIVSGVLMLALVFVVARSVGVMLPGARREGDS
ncbi:hypothetical protein [Paraburkholderia tuberum]|uniref:Uncharacterized protein n=1 Tax=Paraburkholderia tuberum TaxID=157910 RepID=A0A1H1JCH8_9BURK|nr:hypothetical protein [Paraburkholderia tuberum]SDR47158.1 hypothetical protein SAMN05445850_4515 [Paraburkholderia tuberum]